MLVRPRAAVIELLFILMDSRLVLELVHAVHGLRTPNENMNQRNLIFWADVADKICFSRTKKFGIGI